MMWVVFGFHCTLGYVTAETETEALVKARAYWGKLRVVYAQPCGGLL